MLSDSSWRHRPGPRTSVYKFIISVMAVIKADIFDNLGISHSEASELRMRADLLDAILRVVHRRKYTQKQLAVILDDHQPNMSDLMNGKIAKFSIDKLVRYADRLGIETRIQTVEHKERQLAGAG
jgi:predicted XRE-type DNA-binding protein